MEPLSLLVLSPLLYGILINTALYRTLIIAALYKISALAISLLL